MTEHSSNLVGSIWSYECALSLCTESKDIASESLVPGDVLIVPPTGMVMPCDAALLTGHAIVNEAMLTGVYMYICAWASVCVCAHVLVSLYVYK